MISFPFYLLKQLENRVDSPVDPCRFLEHVSSREDDQQHQQNRDRKQQRELLANENHENRHAHSKDEQKPQAKEILRVEAAGVSQQVLMSLHASKQSLNISLRLVVLSHRFVIERSGSPTPRQ